MKIPLGPKLPHLAPLPRLCVGGGLGRACTVPGVPAGRVCCTHFLAKLKLFRIRHL